MLICDRFEEDFAVIYDGDIKKDVPRNAVSEEVCEGDAVVLIDGVYYPDKEGTARLKNEARDLMRRLGLL